MCDNNCLCNCCRCFHLDVLFRSQDHHSPFLAPFAKASSMAITDTHVDVILIKPVKQPKEKALFLNYKLSCLIKTTFKLPFLPRDRLDWVSGIECDNVCRLKGHQRCGVSSVWHDRLLWVRMWSPRYIIIEYKHTTKERFCCCPKAKRWKLCTAIFLWGVCIARSEQTCALTHDAPVNEESTIMTASLHIHVEWLHSLVDI